MQTEKISPQYDSPHPPLPVLVGNQSLASYITNTASDRVRKRDVCRDVFLISLVDAVAVLAGKAVGSLIGPPVVQNVFAALFYCAATFAMCVIVGQYGQQSKSIRSQRLFSAMTWLSIIGAVLTIPTDISMLYGFLIWGVHFSLCFQGIAISLKKAPAPEERTA